MAFNMTEAISRIKAVGANRVRAVPMPGQSIGGLYQIEVSEAAGTWVAIVEGLAQATANDLIRQATNRVICG
jgi:hypothetical protein